MNNTNKEKGCPFDEQIYNPDMPVVPKRIQRKRTKGWKMPENTIYVGRGTKWGNPMKVIGKKVFVQRFHSKTWVPFDNIVHDNVKKFAITWYQKFMNSNSKKHPKKYDLSELKGKNLACFCKEGEPCHADVLIELANKNN